MSSSIAWLDTSAQEQRRARDLIALFSQTESRDELGIGSIRDVLSEALFPGTSVLQTRARYFLIIPWCFEKAANQHSTVPFLTRAHTIERRLIPTLQKTDDDGVIGRQAGASIKTLPSAMFWGGLGRYAILTAPRQPSQLRGLSLNSGAHHDGEDELALRRIGEWDPAIPSAPAGFPDSLEGGLSLTREEASWLADRILQTTQGTFLSHLVLTPQDPDGPVADAPWEDPRSATAPEEVREVLGLAHGFAKRIHGAAIAYNVMIAERYVAEGFTAFDDPVGSFRRLFEEWLARLHSVLSRSNGWDLGALWSLMDASSIRVSPRTRSFVTDWMSMVEDGSVAALLENLDSPARHLILNRERSLKGGRSRLSNTKLLSAWGGWSGAGELTYRWGQVRRIVEDIHQGLALHGEPDA